MNCLIFSIASLLFLLTVDIATSRNVVEPTERAEPVQDANGMQPLTPEDLQEMELIERPCELGQA